MTDEAVPLTDKGRVQAEWISHGERGSMLLLRIMAFLSRHCGRRASRVILYGIALYFFLFAPGARRSSTRYLELALGRTPHMRDRFRHILSFATTIHDRVFLINQQWDLFDISVEGDTGIHEQLAAGRGVLLMGAHLGSFEVMHTLGRRRPGLKVALAMYEANARKIGAIIGALNPGFKADIVPLGSIDAMLSIAERLDHGGLVGVLGDRTLGQESVQAVTLLGRRAHLPIGPMRAAAILRCPVYFMAGLYRGRNRYHVRFESLADFSRTAARGRDAEVRAAIDRYAAAMDSCCRSDPYNWFNFFDFWGGAG
jgi:predicted LPLAT superfamily acyltransferase